MRLLLFAGVHWASQVQIPYAKCGFRLWVRYARHAGASISAEPACLLCVAWAAQALGRAKSAEAKADPQLRQEALVDALTLDTFGYLTRGLFERHRFVLLMELAMRVAVARGELSQQAIRFFIDTTPRRCSANPLSTWLPDEAWAAVQARGLRACLDARASAFCAIHAALACHLISVRGNQHDARASRLLLDLLLRARVRAQALASLDGFKALPREVEGASKRWKEWFEAEQPERAAFPQEWESLSGFDRLLLVRALRPDRLLVAGRLWASTALVSTSRCTPLLPHAA
eukprot:6177762-Pleurochrysis_carterae.AAC.1